ncbi:MAG: retropepsin-like domain-containing protein [Spirosomaceae bacterium]|jgi:predicted aspartyl protease|nr:retropepsin-like domain-containing protein [Spirosomataceae bacterium]
MSILKIPIHYEGSLGEKVLYTLFDSGATFSCISPEAVEDLEQLIPLHRPKRVATASEGAYLEITHCVRLDFSIEDVMLSDEFMVIPNLSEDAIIGVTTLQKWRIKLDFEHDRVDVDPKVAKAILKNLKYKI